MLGFRNFVAKKRTNEVYAIENHQYRFTFAKSLIINIFDFQTRNDNNYNDDYKY